MSVDQANKAFLTFSLIRTAIERSRWVWLLIALIIADGLLAAAAWYVVGYIIQN